ncbi:MAG: hypothetical protein DRN25_02640, partial [Thermoplasmata archaeon]
MDVVTIGHVSIDKVKINEKEKTQLGGAAVYSAMAAKIFAHTGVVSRVGEDFPYRFLALLKKYGINIEGLKKVRGRSTNFKIEYDEDGIAKYTEYKLNVGKYIRPSDIPKTYLKAEAFHLAPMAATKQQKFIDFLKKRGGIISLNTHIGFLPRYRRKLLELIPQVDIFTLNEEEALKITNAKRLEYAIKFLKKIEHEFIIVTLGVIGSVVIDKDVTFFPSVYQPKVIDLTGCGDAFAGAFLASFIRTKDPLKSANIAN